MADPALAARLLGATSAGLLAGLENRAMAHEGGQLGPLFQSLVMVSVRVYAQSAEARVFHLRTHGGEHEVDLIMQGVDGRIVALEIKLAASVSDRDVRHLRWPSERLGPRLADTAAITTGPYAFRRRDGIGIIPAALLTA